jgi:hypothetical protein
MLTDNEKISLKKNRIKIKNYFQDDQTQFYYTIPYQSYLVFLFQSYNIKHKIENNIICFECDTIQTLNEYIENNGDNRKLNYQKIVKIIYDVGILIKFLEEDKMGIFCFSLDDFIVINNNFFLFVNQFKLSNIYKNNLTLTIPINKSENFIDFNMNFSHLPIKEYFTISYYSFGLMIFNLLTGERNSKENNFLLNQIYSTPLYYFILRCLNSNPKERYYIYI